MFRYNKAEKSPVFKKQYVDGWRENNLLTTLSNPEDRYFKVKTGDIEVIIDIHFIESFMSGLKDQGFMRQGVRLMEPLHRGSKLDRETAQNLVSYLSKHNSKSTMKMPFGSLDLLMSFISYSPFMYDQITEFEKDNYDFVEEIRLEKQKYLASRILKESNSQTESATQTYEGNLKMATEKYEEMIEKNYKLGNKAVADNLRNTVIPKMEAALQENYVEKLMQITDFEEAQLKAIPKKTVPTYSFYINDFDILVKKTGDKKLKLATIYPDTKEEPHNVFLHIPSYGNE
jgi:hypothetical protein